MNKLEEVTAQIVSDMVLCHKTIKEGIDSEDWFKCHKECMQLLEFCAMMQGVTDLKHGNMEATIAGSAPEVTATTLKELQKDLLYTVITAVLDNKVVLKVNGEAIMPLPYCEALRQVQLEADSLAKKTGMEVGLSLDGTSLVLPSGENLAIYTP